MNVQQIVIGLVMLLVFWAFQKGYADSLGTSVWFLGAIIFSVLLMLMGKAVMPKPPEELKKLWNFAILFALAATFAISFLGSMLGAVFPPNFTPAALTPLVLSLWLMVFGGTLFVGAQASKELVGSLIGVIWLFSSLHFVTSVGTGPNSYLHFGLITGLSFIIAGLLQKK